MSASRLTALLALAACGAPTGPSPLDELAEARTRWEAQRLESYQFELTRMCLCVLGGQVVAVTVEAGAVTAAAYDDSGTAVEPALLSYLPTIPDLFDLIEDALSGKGGGVPGAEGKPPARFSATYHPTAGYPTRIEIDYSALAIDDEITILVSGLTPLREAAR